MLQGRPDQIIRSRRIVIGDEVVSASLLVKDGVIGEICEYEFAELTELQAAPDVIIDDVGDLVVMSGLVDTHVHVNEPGRTEWEGYESATRAAAAGGITTLVDMPLNCIPATTSLAALDEKRAAAEGACAIDVGFWGGVVPGNRDQLRAMIDAGVMGFKCFLIDSGVPEFEYAKEADVRAALAILGEAGVPLLCHAELAGPIDAAAARVAAMDPRRYVTYLSSRPPEAEELAIAMMVKLCAETGAPVHIVHHSAASALALVEGARQDGLPLTAETCPHYLHFAAEDIPDGATEFKCAPPIRERDNREALWQALASGVLDMVVSDHSPCTVGLKKRDAGHFMDAWGGVASLQITLPVVWTDARQRAVSLPELARWMCARPARLAGLPKKGAIARGMDADLVIWNPDEAHEIAAERLQHRNKITPYHGQNLWGVVEKTYLRGRCVFRRGQYSAPAGAAGAAGAAQTPDRPEARPPDRHGRLCQRETSASR